MNLKNIIKITLLLIITSIKTILSEDERIKEMRVLDAARSKISDLFPDYPIINVQPLTGGFSGTLLYKVILEKDVFLVIRLIHNRTKEDRKREIIAQNMASKGEYGPHVYEADEENGYIIMEFLSPEQHGISDIKKLEIAGILLRAMHQGEKLPHSQSMFEQIQYLYEKNREKLNKIYDCTALERLLKEIEQYKIQWKDDQKPTHRDCNPNNILFSKEKLYLIDFENAAQDDPYFDLATIGIFQVFTPEHEQVLLDNYFERKPTDIEKNRYVFMKNVAFLYYALTILNRLPQEKYATKNEYIPEFSELIQKINEKKFDLQPEENRFMLALSMLNKIKK